jgi:hypothetical protein
VAAVVGEPLELRQQPRLADPGLADQLDRARETVERTRERAQLLRASDEGLHQLGHASPTLPQVMSVSRAAHAA